MRTLIRPSAGARRPVLVLALALTPACGGNPPPAPAPPAPATVTTVITFNELAGNTHVGEHYLAQGVEFTTGPLFPGYGANRLPIVIDDLYSGDTENKLALIHPFQIGEPGADTNLMWTRLHRPAQRVQVRVRNLLGSPVTVRLLARNPNGGTRQAEEVVPVAPGENTTLTVQMGRPNIDEFMVYAKGGVIMVDEVTFDHEP